MDKISELQLGKAGEYLVCADLIIKGYIAFISEQGLHYDIVMDYHGKLIRIQVKTTSNYRFRPQRKEQIPSYLFQCRRCGKGGRKSYANSDIDIMAFVGLKERIIGYLPISEVRQTMMFRSRACTYKGNRPGVYLDDLSLDRAIQIHFSTIKRNGEQIDWEAQDAKAQAR